jgi:serine protease Do
VLDADVALDIALIKVDGKNLPAAKLGNSDDLLVGEWTLAMGNPFGNLIENPTPTVTAGVISALNRNFRPSQDIPRVYLDMIQTDAAINPGNSGGALANAAGEIIGINTFIVSRSGGAEGIGFAIPINRVKAVVQEIVEHGKIRARLVDFQTSTLSNRIGKMLNTNAENGAVVTEVSPDGPAAKAGLKVGDVITKVNGNKVSDAQDLKLKVWYNRQVGSRFRFDVDRSGKPVELEYQLVEPPAEDK